MRFLSMFAALLPALFCLSGCHASADKALVASVSVSDTVASRPVFRIVKARAYRTNGDYADKVPVLLSADGTRVEWCPEYNTVDRYSAPAQLVDGYLLDRLQVSPGMQFTSWTFEEYSQLSETPDDAEIIRHLLPGAKVTEIIEIPLDRRFALQHPEICDSILISHRSDCKILYKE